ncbi:diacylglycerol/lipid kinase family protein, partial [Kitasatospora sp. NPDC059648]|uniref:diacylglycerol/lipid kinase family protein n=1 Tax=Kitasatospora sp. NPDC059648 TaxID=3346894 RepID=UPI00369BDBE0
MITVLEDRTARRAALRGAGSVLLATALATVAAGALAHRRPRPGLGPGDVLAGAALGAGTAALTLRWWPRRDDRPAGTSAQRTDAPALPTGAGLQVVLNAGSGSGAFLGAAPEETLEALRAELPDAGIQVCRDGDDLAVMLDRAAALAVRTNGALGICGGDGSVNLAASTAAREGLPLAVFPGGTLNHFATDLGALTVGSTAEAVRTGSACAVDLGLVVGEGSRPFVNTFSLGIYPELVRTREGLEKRLGKWPALAVALVRVLATAEPVRVEVSGVPRNLWLLFAGNGRYRPSGFAPTRRTQLDDGLLDVRAVDGGRRFARTRLVLAFLTGNLATSPVYREARLTALDLGRLEGVEHLAVDGEAVPAPARLRVAKAPAGLTVYRPEPDWPWPGPVEASAARRTPPAPPWLDGSVTVTGSPAGPGGAGAGPRARPAGRTVGGFRRGVWRGGSTRGERG